MNIPGIYDVRYYRVLRLNITVSMAVLQTVCVPTVTCCFFHGIRQYMLQVSHIL